MWIPHADFGPELAHILKRRRYAEAVSFWRAARPFAQLSVPSTSMLTELMETDPPCLAFLRPRELEAIQIAAGLASLVGATQRLGRFVTSTLAWPHPMSKDAAVQNLISACRIERQVEQLLRDERNFGARVRVQNCCDGACITCLLASSREFPLDHCPPVPIVGCVNHTTGCRCSIAVTSMSPEHDALSRLS